MTYVHDKKTMGKKPNLDKGLGIDSASKNRAVGVDYVIDTNKRSVKDSVNNDTPRFTK